MTHSHKRVLNGNVDVVLMKNNEKTLKTNNLILTRMGKRISMLLACLLLTVSMAFAQTKVTGTVFDASTGEPLIGASVLVEGTGIGAATDVNGHFTINDVPASAKNVVVSYLGMITKRFAIKSVMNIYLEPDAKSLDKVMVVAYGTATKESFTGNASVIGSADIEKIQTTNAVNALNGRVPGVQFNQSSGAPGNNPSIIIHGIGTINASTSPLYVVDGAIFNGDLSTINPADIESMTVMKDAASTALYGPKAANGVIIVTTKKAKAGVTNITLDAKWGSNSRAIPDYAYVTSPAKYYEMWYAALKNYRLRNGASEAEAHSWASANLIGSGTSTTGLNYNVYNVPAGQELIGTNGKLNPSATLGNLVTGPDGNQYYLYPDKWSDAIFQNGLRQEYNLTASGASEKSNFYSSFNYLNMEGITVNSKYERLTGRLKSDYQLKDWLKIGGNFAYGHTTANTVNGSEEGNNSTGNVFAVTKIAPIYPIYIRDANGNVIWNQNAGVAQGDYGDGTFHGLSRAYLSQANPLTDNKVNREHTDGNTFDATGFAEARFLKDFKFTTLNTVHVDEMRYNTTTNPFFGQYAASGGIANVEHDRRYSLTFQQILDWNHTFGEHEVAVTLGHDYNRNRLYYLYGSKSRALLPDNEELNGAVVDQAQAGSYRTDYNYENYFGRLRYAYADKYHAMFSLSRAGSSRFKPGNRWGTFIGAGLAWMISKEDWFNVSWIDSWKLKASLGSLGNDGISNHLYTTTYGISNSNGSVASTPRTLGNEDLQWEKNTNWNFGTEFDLFNSRLHGEVNFYLRYNYDMLNWFTLPTSYGYTGYWDNIGDIRNIGWEILLDGDVIRTSDFTWNLRGNISFNSNKITKIPDQNKITVTPVEGVEGYASSNYFYGEGRPIYTWYMQKWAGVNPENGAPLYYKQQNKTISDEDVAAGFVNYDVDGKEILAVAGDVKRDSKGNALTEIVTTETYSEATQFLCGSALPKATGGFGTTFTWKGFDLNADFTYQLGGKVMDWEYQRSMNVGSTGSRGGAFHKDALKAWTPENTSSNIPYIYYGQTNNASTSSRFLTNASYLCLQNITLGYTLPQNLVSKLGLSKLRVYATADNVWLWSKRQGLDPRQYASGDSNMNNYSPIRTISGGITVSF